MEIVREEKKLTLEMFRCTFIFITNVSRVNCSHHQSTHNIIVSYWQLKNRVKYPKEKKFYYYRSKKGKAVDLLFLDISIININ